METTQWETFQTISFSIFFGIVLPTFDAGGDIRLGIRLYENGHPKWALSVFTPVFINTIFTMVVCKQIEQDRKGLHWICYLPLVFLQLYPQYCILRLILELWKGNINLY